jgi:streptogramin lyase
LFALASATVIAVVASAASGSSFITEYSSGLSAGAGPNVIAQGANGEMWFSEYGANKIGRITSSGSITEFPTAGTGLTANAGPSGVVLGSDGNVWFTEYSSGKIGEISPSTGHLVGEYPLPSGGSSGPEGIVVGPDGELWFTERGASKIGRLDPTSATAGTSNGISEYALGGPQPSDLVDGPSGTIWITLVNTSQIASVLPGALPNNSPGISYYSLPTANSGPEGLVFGSDDKLWVAENTAGKFAEVDAGAVQANTSDGITEFPAGGHPKWVTEGGDGHLWAADLMDSELIQFDRSTHATTTYGPSHGVNGDVTTDAVDTAGNVWFTEFNANKVGEVSTAQVPHTLTVFFSGTGGGTITSDALPQISCPGTCTQQYPYGTTVTLTEVPHPSTIFLGWLGACSSSNTNPTCTVTSTADLSVGAKYQKLSSGPGPTNQTPPHISGVPKAGQTLTCGGDVWSYPAGWPQPHLSQHTWYEAPPATIGNRAPSASQVAAGSPITLGDYPPGATVYCSANANLSTTTAKSQTLTVRAVVPELDRIRIGGHLVLVRPSIDSTRGAGQTNTCKPGIWQHYPAKFRYAWYVVPGSTSAPSAGTLVGSNQTLKLTAADENGYLMCSVTASNAAGATTELSNRYFIQEPDLGFQIDGIEITQGIQTSEVPTRSALDQFVSYKGVVVPNGPSPGMTTVKLAAGKTTVVRVYISSAQALGPHQMPGMILTADSNGHTLGTIGPDNPQPRNADHVGTAFHVDPSWQLDPSQAYTFTLPSSWTTGDVTFTAQLTTACFSQCVQNHTDRITLGPEHFNDEIGVTISPIAFTVNGIGPQGYTQANPTPDPDPQWTTVRDVVPFSVGINPYQQLVEVGGTIAGCAGTAQPPRNATPVQLAQFSQAVYQNRLAALVQAVSSWASTNATAVLRDGTRVPITSIYPFGVVPSGIQSTCNNAPGIFGGGVTFYGPLFSGQPQSVATDDRPLTGMAHEFHHGIGLQHAGLQCNSGGPGTPTTATASATAGSPVLTGVQAQGALVPGQPITGTGIPQGVTTLIQSISRNTITMTNPATASTTNATYSFGVGGIGQVGVPWPPTFVGSTGQPEDGLLDGIGLRGLDTPSNSPYTIVGPGEPGVANRQFFDLMSYCAGTNESNAWISVFNWNYDIAFHPLGSTHAADRATSAPSYVTSPPANASDVHTLAVSSVYSPLQGRTLLTDVHSDASAATPTSAGATYSLTARDASGQVVASSGAIGQLLHVEGATGLILIRGKIAAAGAREVDVLMDGKVIAQDHASPHAPTVTLLAPGAGQRFGGPHGGVIRWRSHDADGGPLQVTLDYSLNGGRSWRAIYSGPDHGTARVPGHLIGASRNARLRIYISDGFNEAIGTSPRFVSRGVPPQVVITEPIGTLRRPAGAAVNFSATAYDDTGALLTHHSLVWRAGRQLLGHGVTITTMSLPVGRHRIRVTARDQHGRTTSASATVTVIPSPPQPILLHAPHRVSRHARSVKLRIALLASARLTVGRKHYLVGRRARILKIAIHPGRKPLVLVLGLRSGRYVYRTLVTVIR